MSVYDELIVELTKAWRTAGVRYKNSRRAYSVSKQTMRRIAPFPKDFDDPWELPDMLEAVYKAWLSQFGRNLHRVENYATLRKKLERMNTAARGLVIGDDVLAGRRLSRKVQQEVFDRNVHGVLEAHHIIEKGWRTSFKRLEKLFPDDDVMPAIALPQSDHRGNVSQIAGLVGEKLPENLLKTSTGSITKALNSRIVAKGGKTVDGVTPRLVVDSNTTESQFLAALHDVYREHDKDLYEKVIKAQLQKVEADLLALP